MIRSASLGKIDQEALISVVGISTAAAAVVSYVEHLFWKKEKTVHAHIIIIADDVVPRTCRLVKSRM